MVETLPGKLGVGVRGHRLFIGGRADTSRRGGHLKATSLNPS
jgi:hypothetical protein